MNIKKIIAGTMAVALTAAVSVGGTLAYLMDTDEDVNVMTLGDVYIDQIEQERVDDNAAQTELKDFEQNQPLLPAVYPKDTAGIPWADPSEWVVPNDEAWKVVEDNTNVIDKFVTVKNTGKSDAYVRTIIAFEEDSSLIHYVYNGANITEGATWVWEENVGTIVLDGVTYSLYVATYTEPLKPGATTIPSLKQVYMDNTATNDYCEKLGDTYDILVYSQAVQTEGFDSIIVGPDAALNEAFGDITSTNNPWVNGDSNFTPAVNKDLADAISKGGDVTLSGDVAITDAAAEAKNIITEDTTVNFSANTVTLDLPYATSATENWVGINVNGGTVVFEGTTGGVTTAANDELYAVVVRNGADLTINGGSYIGGTTAISVTEGTVTINGGYFASQTDNPAYTINCVDAAYKAGTANVIIKGGSFLNWNPANNAAEGAGTNYVADGYTVVAEKVANGTLYTVQGMIPALAEGGKVTLSSDITVTDEAAAAKNVITKDTVLNFGGNTVTLDLPNATGATANWVGVNVDGGNVVFEGADGGVTCANNGELYAVVVRNGADLTINGGEYIGGTSAVSVTKGILTINGGYFAVQTENTSYVINCIDSAYKNNEAQVIIKGGSFLNWNPANNAAEGAGTSFLAPGYKVVEETVANGTLYTVVAE